MPVSCHELKRRVRCAEGDESDEDEGPDLFDAAEPEDGSDAELAAVLDNAAALVGRKRQRTGTNPAAALGEV